MVTRIINPIFLVVLTLNMARPASADLLFFDDFGGPSLDGVYQASLPNASFRLNGPDATYLGASGFTFQALGGVSVLRIQNNMGDTSRRGWSTSTVFPATEGMRLEARVNTLVQSKATGIDQFAELWILDAADPARHEKFALGSEHFGVDRLFTSWSTITNTGLDTPFSYTDNTWYRMVLTGSTNQDVRLSIYDDTGLTELVGVSLGHNLSAFPSGFRLGLSQSTGGPGQILPLDGAIDWIRLTDATAAVPESSSLLLVLVVVVPAGVCSRLSQVRRRWRLVAGAGPKGSPGAFGPGFRS